MLVVVTVIASEVDWPLAPVTRYVHCPAPVGVKANGPGPVDTARLTMPAQFLVVRANDEFWICLTTTVCAAAGTLTNESELGETITASGPGVGVGLAEGVAPVGVGVG